MLELLKHQDCALVAGCSIAPEPRPLHVSRWNRRHHINVSQRWFLSFSDHTDVYSHVHVPNQLSLTGDGDYRRGGPQNGELRPSPDWTKTNLLG